MVAYKETTKIQCIRHHNGAEYIYHSLQHCVILSHQGEDAVHARLCCCNTSGLLPCWFAYWRVDSVNLESLSIMGGGVILLSYQNQYLIIPC